LLPEVLFQTLQPAIQLARSRLEPLNPRHQSLAADSM
jgi:hypothetical protein